ncbi:hypothetical protein CBL_14444 [Carabus blaptoides fortunei]
MFPLPIGALSTFGIPAVPPAPASSETVYARLTTTIADCFRAGATKRNAVQTMLVWDLSDDLYPFSATPIGFSCPPSETALIRGYRSLLLVRFNALARVPRHQSTSRVLHPVAILFDAKQMNLATVPVDPED